jgi:hypothetical protein
MLSGICKGVLKVGAWEAQKGLEEEAQKNAQRHWEAQFQDDFRLHPTQNQKEIKRGCCRKFRFYITYVATGAWTSQGGSLCLLIVHKGGGARAQLQLQLQGGA